MLASRSTALSQLNLLDWHSGAYAGGKQSVLVAGMGNASGLDFIPVDTL